MRESTLQKFVIRQLKQIDDIVRGAETKLSRGMVVLVDNKGKEKEEDGDGAVDDDEASVGSPELNKFTPTKMNPVYLFAYGAMLMVTGSFQSAISLVSLSFLSEVPCELISSLDTENSLPSSRLRDRARTALD